jgi:CHRD domain
MTSVRPRLPQLRSTSMRAALTTSLALAAVSMAACGSSARKHEPPPAKVASNPAQAKVRSRTFSVVLLGSKERPVRLHTGSARASVTIRPHDQVCWSITQLSNVTSPMFVYLNRAAASATGPIVVALGQRYAASGCVSDVAPALLVSIERHANGYYLNIPGRAHPLGAIRGQL